MQNGTERGLAPQDDLAEVTATPSPLLQPGAVLSHKYKLKTIGLELCSCPQNYLAEVF